MTRACSAVTFGSSADGSLIGVNTVGATTSTGVLAYTDAHDDVVGNFTATGAALTGSATYDPFGNPTAGAGLAGRLGYQSGWTDSATGKVNMAARWYNPAVGQFQNKDTASLSPLPDSIAANPFAYVDANPLTRTDPTGHGWDVTSTVSDTWDSGSSFVSNTWDTATSCPGLPAPGTPPRPGSLTPGTPCRPGPLMRGTAPSTPTTPSATPSATPTGGPNAKPNEQQPPPAEQPPGQRPR